MARYRARAAAGRGPGHFDATRGERELWDDHVAPLGLGPVLEVDTSAEVSVTEVARRVRHFRK